MANSVGRESKAKGSEHAGADILCEARRSIRSLMGNFRTHHSPRPSGMYWRKGHHYPWPMVNSSAFK